MKLKSGSFVIAFQQPKKLDRKQVAYDWEFRGGRVKKTESDRMMRFEFNQKTIDNWDGFYFLDGDCIE